MMTRMTGIMGRIEVTSRPEAGFIASVEALFHKAVRISRCFEVIAKRAIRLYRFISLFLQLEGEAKMRPQRVWQKT